MTPHIAYDDVKRIYLLVLKKQIGSIPAGRPVTNLVGFARSDPIFGDWLANNNVDRKDARIVRAFVPKYPIGEVYL